VLDCDALPDVWLPSKLWADFSQSLGAFCENLKTVPTGSVHDAEDPPDEGERNVFVLEVAHGVDKNGLRALPE